MSIDSKAVTSLVSQTSVEKEITPAAFSKHECPKPKQSKYSIQNIVLVVIPVLSLGLNILLVRFQGEANEINRRQFVENQQKEKVTEFRNLLLSMLENKSSEKQFGDDFSKGETPKLFLTFEKLKELESSISDRLSASDYCHMAFFSVITKGRVESLEYIQKANRKLDLNYSESEAVYLCRTWSDILRNDYLDNHPESKTIASEIIRLDNEAIAHAKKLEPGTVRNLTLAYSYLLLAEDYYMLKLRKEGDEALQAAKEVKVYRGPEQLGHLSCLENSARNARIRNELEVGELSGSIYYHGYRSRMDKNQKLVWDVLTSNKSAKAND